MTKVKIIKPPENIHLNINETFDFIMQWLPRNYSAEVNKLLDPKDRVNPAYIRQVKRERIDNKKIILAMYRIALFNKAQLEKIETK